MVACDVVYFLELIPPNSQWTKVPFLLLDNIIPSPHMAALPKDSAGYNDNGSREGVVGALEDRRPRFFVNPWANMIKIKSI